MAWLELEVTPLAAQIAPARHAVHRFLCDEGVPVTVAEDLRLVASELVTNAVAHGQPATVAVKVGVVAPDVVLAVANVARGASLPSPASWGMAPVGAVSGRGLGLVAALCDHVEVRGDDQRVEVVCRRSWLGAPA